MVVKIGILGGGQLAQMLAISAKKTGAMVYIYTDQIEFCAKDFCDDFFIGNYDDKYTLSKFVDCIDVMLYEFENVDISALKSVDQRKLFSKIEIIEISQNRIKEKIFATVNSINTPKYIYGTGTKDLEVFYPSVIKTTTLGYDGKGQVVLRSKEDLTKALDILKGEWILEELIDFDFEGSVIFYKKDEKIYNYDTFKNTSEDGILMKTELLDDSKKYFDYFNPIVKNIDFNGIICIEFFVKNDTIYFNEIAPRVHNSGHITLKSHLYSQFDNLINIVMGYDVCSKRLTNDLVMHQVLGQDYIYYKSRYNFYDYNKGVKGDKRKLGHYITFKGE